MNIILQSSSLFLHNFAHHAMYVLHPPHLLHPSSYVNAIYNKLHSCNKLPHKSTRETIFLPDVFSQNGPGVVVLVNRRLFPFLDLTRLSEKLIVSIYADYTFLKCFRDINTHNWVFTPIFYQNFIAVNLIFWCAISSDHTHSTIFETLV